MIHGGAIFTLIDEAFEISCNSHGTVAVALNVNITYHRAPSPNSTLRAEARGRSQGSLKDQENRQLLHYCQGR